MTACRIQPSKRVLSLCLECAQEMRQQGTVEYSAGSTRRPFRNHGAPFCLTDKDMKAQIDVDPHMAVSCQCRAGVEGPPLLLYNLVQFAGGVSDCGGFLSHYSLFSYDNLIP